MSNLTFTELNNNSSNKYRIIWTGLIIFVLLLIPIWFIGLKGNLGLILLLGILGLPFIVLCFTYPKIWLYSIAALSFLFFRSSDEGVSTLDVFFGIFYEVALYLWLFWKIAIQKEKLIYNKIDWFFLFIFIALIFNVFIALANNIDPLFWLREYMMFSNILFFFPIRYYIKTDKEVKILLILFGISMFLSAIDQLRMYKEVVLSQALYAYQITSSIRLNQVQFSSTIFFTFMFMNLKIKWIYRLLLIGLISSAGLGLIVSFSRIFWVFVMIELIILFIFYLKTQQKVISIIIVLALISIGTVVINTAFKTDAKLAFSMLKSRLESSTKGKQDISLQLRLIEFEVVYDGIFKYPLGGNGLAKTISFYNPLLQETSTVANIHNGYLFLAYKMGIPLTVIFVFCLLYYLFLGEKFGRRTKDMLSRSIFLSSVASILIVLIGSVVSNQFINRDGTFVIAISIALISIYKDREIKKVSDNNI